MPVYDFCPVCPVACIRNCHSDFRCGSWAQVLADVPSVHLLFPSLCNVRNSRMEGALCWHLCTSKVEQQKHLCWVFLCICLKKHKYIISNIHDSHHLQMSFHWLHWRRKTACSTGCIRSLKNLEVSIKRKESHWIWQSLRPLLALCYLPAMARTFRKRS